jgi:hypothetical protein
MNATNQTSGSIGGIARGGRTITLARRLLLAVAGMASFGAFAQIPPSVPPTNDLPNPYTSTRWGTLPEGRQWGALSAVGMDNDGSSVWVADRCGANPEAPPGAPPFQFDSCAGSKLPPILKFDASGALQRAFGADLFVFPHKVYQDRAGNVWVVDQRGYNERERKRYPGEKPKGHVVVKFSPEGKVLLTIGTPGVAGHPPQALTEPTSIVELPNGDLLISEGHTSQPPLGGPDPVARISRYSADGKFIRSFGKFGAGPGEFKIPHDITLDESGRLFVADRANYRIQILDLEGRFIAEWKQFSRPSGVVIRNGLIYVADSESNGVAPNPGWLRGIRIGNVSDGRVLYRIPDPLELKGTSAAEGIAVDARGNVYGAEVGPRQVVRHQLNLQSRGAP